MDERYIIAQDRCLKTVIKRIKEAMRFYDPKESKYQFEVPSTKTPVYDPRMGHFCLPRIHGRSKRHSTQDPATAKKAMRIFFILKTILKNLRRKNPPMCQKEIFYKDLSLFKRDSNKKVKDSKEEEEKEKNKDYKINFIPLIKKIGILLETTRFSLNISVTPKGYIIGEVKLYINGGERLSCKDGRVIPDKTFQINRIKREIRFILIVEKYTMYSKLKRWDFIQNTNVLLSLHRVLLQLQLGPFYGNCGSN